MIIQSHGESEQDYFTSLCEALSPSPVQTGATLLDVTWCVRLHILLHVVTCCCVLLGVVAQSLKPVKLLKQLLLPTFLLFRDHRSVAQHDGSICTARQTLFGPRTRIMGCILPTMHCKGTIVGSCCIRLHTTANKGAVTLKIVGPTMLGVVASVCA